MTSIQIKKGSFEDLFGHLGTPEEVAAEWTRTKDELAQLSSESLLQRSSAWDAVWLTVKRFSDNSFPAKPTGKDSVIFAIEEFAKKASGPLSVSEQQALMKNPYAIAQLINQHDCWIVEADARDMSECVPHHEKRIAELLTLGRAIIAEDPECFDRDVKLDFVLRHTEKVDSNSPSELDIDPLTTPSYGGTPDAERDGTHNSTGDRETV